MLCPFTRFTMLHLEFYEVGHTSSYHFVRKYCHVKWTSSLCHLDQISVLEVMLPLKAILICFSYFYFLKRMMVNCGNIDKHVSAYLSPMTISESFLPEIIVKTLERVGWCVGRVGEGKNAVGVGGLCSICIIAYCPDVLTILGSYICLDIVLHWYYLYPSISFHFLWNMLIWKWSCLILVILSARIYLLWRIIQLMLTFTELIFYC